MNNFSKIAVLALVLLLFAPALKVRFDISDTIVYFLPFAVFLFSVVVLNLMLQTFFLDNLTASIWYLFLFGAVLIAFIVGGAQQTELLFTVAVNCFLAATVVIYPWNHRSVHLFFLLSALVAATLAVHTLVFFGSDAALSLAQEDEKVGYLSVSLALGLGCIASLYLVFSKLSPVYIILLGTNWMALAVARGRGAFLVCAIVSIAYIVFILSSRRVSLAKSSRYVILGITLVLVPLISFQLLSLEQNIGRWKRLVTTFAVEVEDGGRGALIGEAVQKINASPVIGNGLGEYRGFYGHPHNMFLQYGVDAGIIGMLLLLVFLARVCVVGAKAVSRHESNNTNMACVAFCYFAYMVGNMMKSGDAYLGREFFIVSAMPIVMFQLLKYFKSTES